MLGYDLGGHHPLHPLRWELTWALAGELGVPGRLRGARPRAGRRPDARHRAHPGYIAAVREASEVGPDRCRARAGHRRQPDLPGHARERRADRRRLGRRGAGDRPRRGRPGGELLRRPAPRDGRPRLRILRLQRRGVGHHGPARRRRPQGRLRRRRRAPRRRRAGRVLRRPPGADGLPARVARCRCSRAPAGRPSSAAAPRRAPRSTSRCRPAPAMRPGCGPSMRSCPAWSARSGRRCWSPSTAPTRTGRIRWPT